jgi:thiol-disulfide isomerase/thioredoxin
MLVFSAHWCGHCDEHMPRIRQVIEEYAPHGVKTLVIAASGGNGTGIAMAFERWGFQRTPAHDTPENASASRPARDAGPTPRDLIGVDRGFRAARMYGVRVFPMVFLVGRDGIIEAVHGRRSNDPTGNGLDDVQNELVTELDILLHGGSRADFPAPPRPAPPRTLSAARTTANLPSAQPTTRGVASPK